MEKPTVLGYIKDQPRALLDIFLRKEEFIQPFIDVFNANKIKKVYFFGSGTSFNASNIGAYYFKHILNMDAVAQLPTGFKNHEKADWSQLYKKDEILFVAISQSGTSISTIEVMKQAKEEGYLTIALTENMDSEIVKHVDKSIHLLCGKELTPPETRGYTVTVLTLYLWTVALAKEKGIFSEKEYQMELEEIKKVIAYSENAIKQSEAWYERNKLEIIRAQSINVLGYGIDYGSALEATLKIGEMLRIPTIAYEMEEYAHGPNMALTDKQVIFIIGSEEVEWERMKRFREVFLQYTPKVYVITVKAIENGDNDLVFSLSPNKYVAPLLYAFPFQFVAAKGAADVGIDTSFSPFKQSLAHLPKEDTVKTTK